ncbi:MAG: 5'/3'-nucleotidase SurE [Sphingomonadales bacterium]
MRILLTNDDGIFAPGLDILESIAHEISDDVWIVAPASEQSGAGHSLSLSDPLRIRCVDEKRYAVTGTPTDSIVLALNHIIKDKRPDLILSGVNRGANMAEDVTYSGTIAGAMEGTLAGIPSMALSQAIDPVTQKVDWGASKRYGTQIVKQLLELGWNSGTFINVNFPRYGADKVKGVKITEQGMRDISDLKIEERIDMRGNPYYWFGLGRDVEAPGLKTDLKVVRDGYISITPLHLNLTHYEMMPRLTEAMDGEF